MARMTASMVVSILEGRNDTHRIRQSLRELERERARNMRSDLLANQRENDRLAQERARAAATREARIAAVARTAALGLTAAGYAAARSYADFAKLERQVGRIVLTADKGAGAIRPTMRALKMVAQETALPLADVQAGLEALVASGRSLEDALAFLPSVAMTAQASGAATEDIARSADAIAGSLGFNANNMQKAFDMLVTGGKAGKFELKDMAQYLPSLLPAFAALGYKGEAGLAKIVAMLQLARNQTGDASEAATNLQNVFQKMTSDEVVKRFRQFGIKDLRRELDDTRRAGGDVVETFLKLTNQAIRGDMSKLNQLFTDQQMQKGMRALVSQWGDSAGLIREILAGIGATQRDVNAILSDSEAKLQRLKTMTGDILTEIGAAVAHAVDPVLEATTKGIDRTQMANEGRGKLYDGSPDLERNARERFFQEYMAKHGWQFRETLEIAWLEALAEVGRGNARSPFDVFKWKPRGPFWSGPSQRSAEDTSMAALDAPPVPTPRPKRPEEMTAEERAAADRRAHAERLAQEYRRARRRKPRNSPMTDDDLLVDIARRSRAARAKQLRALMGPAFYEPGYENLTENGREPPARPSRTAIGASAREAESASMRAYDRANASGDLDDAISEALEQLRTRGGDGIRQGADAGAATLERAAGRIEQAIASGGQRAAAAIQAAVGNIRVSAPSERRVGELTTGQMVRNIQAGAFNDYPYR
jgi:TP901 family phage tail tape measure protein